LKPISPKVALILGRSPLLYHLSAGPGPEPNSAGLERGTFPSNGSPVAPACAEVPKWQVRAYNPGSVHPILRESGCNNYEKPFRYLSKARTACCSGYRSRQTHVAEILSHTVESGAPGTAAGRSRSSSRYSHGHDGSYLRRRAICRKTQCGGGSAIPGWSAEGLRYSAVAHRYRRHRSVVAAWK
jgi:hypothetical protein